MARRSNSLGRGLGARLREARLLRERTLRDLADEVGISPTTLVTIERGDGGNSGVGLLTDIARALVVRPCWLVFGEGSMGLGD